MRFLDGQVERVWCVAYSPDGRSLISGGWRGKVCVWGVGSETPIATWDPPEVIVASLTFLPAGDGVVESASSDRVRVVGFPGGQEREDFHLPTLQDTGEVYFHPLYHPGRGLFAYEDSSDGGDAVTLWHPSWKEPRSSHVHENMVRHMAFSPAGTWLVSAGWDNALAVTDTETGSVALVWKAGARCNAVRVLDEEWALVGVGHSVALYNLTTGRVKRKWAAHKNLIVSLAATPDRRQVVTASDDGTVAVWDVESGRNLLRLDLVVWTDGHECVAVAPDGCSAAIGGLDGRIALIDLDH